MTDFQAKNEASGCTCKRPLRVKTASGLNDEQRNEVTKLVVQAFNHSSINSAMYFEMAVEMEHFITRRGFSYEAQDLVVWCIENEDMLAGLLNLIIKLRPLRDDVKPLILKLAHEGAIQLGD